MRRHKSAFRLVAEPILVAVALAFAVRATMRIYSIPSSSMTPTISVGDHIVVTPYRGALPQHGDVVVFHSPLAGGELSVKRVIAVPGDLIDAEAGHVRLKGHVMTEPYVLQPGVVGEIAPQVVPPGFVFVMGDNRADSLDSRHWGVLPQQRVVGRARLVLWSSGDGSDDRAHEAHASPRVARPSAPTRRGRIFKWID